MNTQGTLTPGLVLLAARPGTGIKSFARSIAADSVIDATDLDAAEIANRIRQLKSDDKLQKPIIVLVQLARMLPGQKYERPQLSDLREIGLAAPEQVADEIWLLDRKFTRTHREEDKYSAELTLINPQNGAEKVIPMRFDPECRVFSGVDFRESIFSLVSLRT